MKQFKLNSSDGNKDPYRDVRLVVRPTTSGDEIIFDVSGRTFNNLSPERAVEIADALYEAAGEGKDTPPAEGAAEGTPERSFGELVDEANVRFTKAALRLSRSQYGLPVSDEQKAVATLFQGLLAAIIYSGRGKEILRDLLD